MGLRQDRLADEIRDIIATMLTSGQLHDDKLLEITITHVKVTADLQLASVYYRVYNEEQLPDIEKAILEASNFLRRKLATTLRLRRIPVLRFFYDESIERGSRIERILHNLRA